MVRSFYMPIRARSNLEFSEAYTCMKEPSMGNYSLSRRCFTPVYTSWKSSGLGDPAFPPTYPYKSSETPFGNIAPG